MARLTQIEQKLDAGLSHRGRWRFGSRAHHAFQLRPRLYLGTCGVLRTNGRRSLVGVRGIRHPGSWPGKAAAGVEGGADVVPELR